jgi:hypothetical protein
MAATSPVRTHVPVGPAIGFAIVDVLTWVIELGVGLGCIAGGVAASRTPRLRIVGVVLLVAGAAACIHAAWALAS